MDTETYIYTVEYYSAKKRMHLSPNEADEPRAYYIEWSKSERKRQILYINACVWNLEKWYWWTYLQGSNGDTDIQNRLVDTVGEGEGGMNWEQYGNIYITICKTASQWKFAVWRRELKSGALWQHRGLGWDGRWDGDSRGRGTYVYLWLIHVDIRQKPTQYCKAIIFQLKINWRKDPHCSSVSRSSASTMTKMPAVTLLRRGSETSCCCCCC